MDIGLKTAYAKNLEMINSSHVFMAVYTNSFLEDPNCLLQLGIAVSKGKPIYLVAKEGVYISDCVNSAASEICYYKDANDYKKVVEDLCVRIAEMAKKEKG